MTSAEEHRRALEQRLAVAPEDRAAALELGALYERCGWVHQGETLTEWRRRLLEIEARPAVAALKSLGPAAAVAAPELARCAFQHEDAWVRWAAAELLRGLGDERATAVLLAGVREPRPDWRAQAFEALARVDPEAGREALVSGLSDELLVSRVAAIEGCSRLARPLSGPEHRALLAALDDPEFRARQAAFRSLSVLRPPGFGASLAGRLNLGQAGGADRQFYEALVEEGDLPGLLALRDRLLSGHRASVDLILRGSLGLGREDRRGLDLALRSPGLGRRVMASLALALRGAEALPTLIARLAEPEDLVAAAAALALGAFADPRARAALIAIRDDRRPQVRECVRMVLEESVGA